MGDSKNVIRSGQISSINAANGTARVTFADKDDLVSYDLPVLQRSTLKNKDYSMPDIGESVVCIFQPNGVAEGFVVGAHYNEEDKPPVSDPDVRMTKFDDGTTLTVDRKAHVVKILDSFGSYIEFAGGNITIKAAGNVYINP